MAESIGNIQATLDADSAGFTGGIGSAVDALGSLGEALGMTRGGIAALGAAGAAVAAGGLAAATQQAIKFERTIAGAAARAGATQQAMEAFGQSAKQASLDSAFGANQAGGALRFLAKSGFEVQEATQALPGILEGATAAGMGAAEMGEIASNALRAFGKSTAETSGVMDVLVKASTNANTSVQELGQGIATAGGIASSMGTSLEQTVGVISMMQDAGISASKAATAIRSGLARLAEPTSKAKETLGALGVEVRDSSGEVKDFVTILSDLKGAGAGAEELARIFGKRMGPTLTTALQSADGSLQRFVGSLENAEGTSKRIAAFIESSVAEQFEILAGSLATLGANIGEIALPALKLLNASLQGLIKLSNTAVTVFKGVGNAFGGWSMESGKATQSTKDMAKASKGAEQATRSLGDATSQTTGKIKEQTEAQKALNLSLREFQKLGVEGKRESFGALAKESARLQKQIPKTRKRIKELNQEVAQTGSPEALSELSGQEQKLQQLLLQQSRIERKISESADAHSGLTQEEGKSLKIAQAKERVLRAETKAEKARAQFQKQRLSILQSEVSRQLKLQRIENARLQMQKKLSQQKEGRSGRERIEAQLGPGQTKEVGQVAPAATRQLPGPQKSKQAEQAELEKTRTEEVERQLEVEKEKTDTLQRGVRGATGLVSEIAGLGGRQAGQAARAGGGILNSLIGGGMSAAMGNPLGLLSAGTGLVGGIGQLLGLGGQRGRTTGGPTRSRVKQNFRTLAKMIGQENAKAMEPLAGPDRVINVEARQGVDTMSQQQASELFRQLERVSETTTGTNLGGR